MTQGTWLSRLAAHNDSVKWVIMCPAGLRK